MYQNVAEKLLLHAPDSLNMNTDVIILKELAASQGRELLS